MSRVAKKSQKKSEVKQSKKYTNMFEAFGAFWHRGFTEWAGTSSRSEYWWSCLMIWLISVVWVALIFISGFSNSPFGLEFVVSPITGILSFGFVIFALASFIPMISLTVRRLHDAGLSAWWIVLFLLGLICEPLGFIVSIVFLVFALLPTKVDGNPYHKFNK